MTRHIPEGSSLRPLKGLIIDLGNALQPEIYPATPQERAADKILRKAMARPEWPRPRPWWIAALFLAAAFFAGAGLALIVGDMIQTGAATAVEAQRVAAW